MNRIVRKPTTKAQAVFGKQFGNREIITARPEGMSFPDYRANLREQRTIISNCLR